MRFVLVFLASAGLAGAMLSGCAASSGKRTAPSDKAPKEGLPAIIERTQPPHYRHIPQGAYSETEASESTGTASVSPDTANASAARVTLEPPLVYDVPLSGETAAPDEKGDEHGGEGE